MSGLIEDFLRVKVIVSVVNLDLLGFRLTKPMALDIFAKVDLLLVLAWASGVDLTLVSKAAWSSWSLLVNQGSR